MLAQEREAEKRAAKELRPRQAIIRELQSMIDAGIVGVRGGGYQVAKSILKLSERSPGVWSQIGPNARGAKRAMVSDEARRHVKLAEERIRIADEGE